MLPLDSIEINEHTLMIELKEKMITIDNVSEVSKSLKEKLHENSQYKNLILDAKEVHILDSTAIKCIMDAAMICRGRGGKLVLLSLTTYIKKVIELLCLTQIIFVVDSYEGTQEVLQYYRR
jgi:anti-anti-sigma factor